MIKVCTKLGLVVSLFSVAACSDGASSPDANTGPDANPTQGSLLGQFEVALIAPRLESDGTTTPGHTTVFGKVYDGVQPQGTIWTTVSTANGCTLLTPSVPFCATPCGGSAVCVAADTCQPYPASKAVGTVQVKGVGSSAGASFDMTPISNGYQPTAATVLNYPAFAEGDAISFRASGSDFTPAFTLATTGVATLTLTNATLALAAGQPLALTWTAPTNGASKIFVKLDISHHGGSKGKIECDVADNGSLTISAAMVDALLALGTAGFPTIVVTRRATGHAAVATGHVDLFASSQVETAIAVPGVISCTDDTNCSPPKTCQPDLTCK